MPGSTQTDIFNLALTRLAVKPVGAPNENTVMATVLSRVWDFCRRNGLSATNWKFANIPGEALVLSKTYTPPSQWLYAYIYPTKALAVWTIYNPALISDPLLIQDPVINPIAPPLQNVQSYLGSGEAFDTVFDPATNAQVILTNCQDALAEYTYDQTDPTLWSDAFVDFMSYFLAAQAAMPLVGDPDLAKQMAAAAQNAASEAKRLSKGENNKEKFGDGSIVNSRA